MSEKEIKDIVVKKNTLLEQNAEEIANKKVCGNVNCRTCCNVYSPKDHKCEEWHNCYESAKEGVESGYNRGYNKGYHDAEEHYISVIESQHKLVDESKKEEFKKCMKCTDSTYQYAFKNGEKKAIELLFENGNLFFEDYEGKVSPITYCDIKDGKIIFKE